MTIQKASFNKGSGKVSSPVKWAIVFILLFYGLIASLGYYDDRSHRTILKIFSLFPLLLLFIFTLLREIKKKSRLPFEKLVFGLSAIILSKALFFYFAQGMVESFPLDILLIILLSVIHPLPLAILYAALIIIINFSHTVGNPYLSLMQDLFRSCFIIILFVVIEVFLKLERRAKNRAEGRLGGIESLATKMSHESLKGKEDSKVAISEEVKDDIFLDSAYNLSKSLSNALHTIQDIAGSFSCCLFVLEEDHFKLCAAVSDSKNLIANIPCQKGKNLISWIYEYDKPLKIDKLSSRSKLGYYSKKEEVNMFLGIPVSIDRNNSKAILCMDRKETPFTKEDEKLLYMAANVAAEYLKNSAIVNEMKVEAREFQSFYAMSKTLSASLDLDNILERALKFSMDIVNADLTAFALQMNNKLHCVKADGVLAGVLVESGQNLEKGIIGWVMDKKKTFQYSRKLQVKKVFPDLPKPLLNMGSFLVMPLNVRNEAIGAFLISRKDHHPFSSYEIKLLEAMSAHVSASISNATMYRKMEALAITDGLTGLYNHRHFQERLSMELERCDRYKDKVSFLLTDIDFFKKVNDDHGHPAGDKILKDVAGILRETIRNVDFASRYGGEEFAIILINADKEEAMNIAQRIRAAVEEKKFDIGNGKKINITMSIGSAIFPADAETQSLLVSRADEALYLAKKEGRNRAYLYRDVRERLVS